MKDNIVVHSNELITAAYSMTAKEKQLLIACISQIDSRVGASTITKQTKFTIKSSDIEDIFYNDKNRRNVYRDLAVATDRLYDRDVEIQLSETKKLRTRFVSGALYDSATGEVTLTFAEDILPYLTQLKANFTKYKLLDIRELSSVHAIRLYELIVCWIGQFQYSRTFDDFDDFRQVMGVEGKYKQFNQLKESVINKAIEEINENTNYRIKAEYRKFKRSFVSMELKFHKKTLDKLVGDDGTLSKEKIQSIVANQQFMNDYNNHPSLSYEGKMNTLAFQEEMMSIINREPESFNKEGKALETYLPKIK